MDLSNDLISKFVKITSGNDKKESKEGTVYGTAVEYDGLMYVKIDGSDLLTPINTTATIKDGERVTIMIKDHNATVTGNISSPSASDDDLNILIAENTSRKEEIQNLDGEIESVNSTLSSKYTSLEQNLSGFKTTVSETYATKSTVNDLSNNLSSNYATKSEVNQTATDLTIKFTESGGYNLLQNGHANKGTSYWVDNGGGIGFATDAGGNATGNFFTTSMTSGIRYHQWVRLNANTHYVYQAKIWSNGTFTGKYDIPLHWWFSSTGSDSNIMDVSVTFIDGDTTYPVAQAWKLLYIHFITPNTNVYMKPFFYGMDSSLTQFHITEIMLSESRTPQPWSPHPAEVYDGISTIDKDGVKVSQSDYSGYTQMSASGFYVNNGSENVISCTSSGLTVKGTINATAGTFSGNIVTNNIVKAYNSVYAGAEIWGGFKLDSSGAYQSTQTFTVHGSAALQIDGNPTRISSVTGEVKIGDVSSYDNLRARCLYAQETVYADDIRVRSASQIGMSNIQMISTDGFIEFSSGCGVIRVPDVNHLYLQTGDGAANTSSEVRCTAYKDPTIYVNLRAHNVCAQNAVYANGVNVSSDRDRKRDIELYETDALSEICTTPVYTYHLDTDLDDELKRIGIIMQEAPLDAIDLSGKGVDLYQMVTMLWKAVQQLNAKIEG